MLSRRTNDAPGFAGLDAKLEPAIARAQPRPAHSPGIPDRLASPIPMQFSMRLITNHAARKPAQPLIFLDSALTRARRPI